MAACVSRFHMGVLATAILSADAAETILGSRGLTVFKLIDVSQEVLPWWRRGLFAKAGPNGTSTPAMVSM